MIPCFLLEGEKKKKKGKGFFSPTLETIFGVIWLHCLPTDIAQNTLGKHIVKITLLTPSY